MAAGWSWWPSRFPVLCWDAPLPCTVLGVPGPSASGSGSPEVKLLLSWGRGALESDIEEEKAGIGGRGGDDREQADQAPRPLPCLLRPGRPGSEQGVPSTPI